MIYGLIAVGYTMVYGIIGMINFAHGDVFMIGAFLSLIALTGLSVLGITSVPLALALTLVFAAVIAALYGWTIERVAYRPLRGSFRLAPLISAIGMSIALQNFAQVAQGARDKNIPDVIPGGLGSQLGVALAALVMIGTREIFRDFQEYSMLVFGIALVVVMVVRPRGLISGRTPSVSLGKHKQISADLVSQGHG